MNDRDRIIRNVPVNADLAAKLTTPDALKKFGTHPMELTLDGESCGHFTVCHLGSEWDDATRTMNTTVDLRPFE